MRFPMLRMEIVNSDKSWSEKLLGKCCYFTSTSIPYTCTQQCSICDTGNRTNIRLV